ncbi:MAG: hypothetical protein D8M57_10510 [Candidatus Scalindua sp. AMX11]|nr:MAG: hypothetical protein DWQ00_03495 [Candidatus Scalindua sp.]TDE64882.1 MAG: hypothetical protein D8M57_10510 [Candidatus Scalindua sp. AMX11]
MIFFIDIEVVKEISLETNKDINRLTPEKLKFKAQTNKINADMYRAIGFYPSQSPAMFIQKIYTSTFRCKSHNLIIFLQILSNHIAWPLFSQAIWATHFYQKSKIQSGLEHPHRKGHKGQ